MIKIRIAWFLLVSVMISLTLGATKTYTAETDSRIVIATPESLNVRLGDPTLTAEGISGMEQATYGNTKGTLKMIWDMFRYSLVPLNVLGDQGGALTQLLNQGVGIFGVMLNIITLLALFALIRGWVQF